MPAGPDTEKWNRIYRSGGHDTGGPARVLAENLHLLPAAGKALDLASGPGGNAIQLARAGLKSYAWDCSDVALKLLQERAAEEGLEISTVQRDVVREPPEPDSFDVIVVVRFLDRRLTRHIIEAIRPQGLLYYQTFIRDKVDDTGPTRPDYLLEVNELLELFNALTIRLYREEGGTGDPGRGFRNEAMLIAQRLA